MDENNNNLENDSTEIKSAFGSLETTTGTTESSDSAADTTSNTENSDSAVETTEATESSDNTTETANSFDAKPTSAFSLADQPSTTQPASTSNQEVFGSSQDTSSSNYYSNNSYTSPEEPVSKGFAIASLVMGILSIVTCCCTITGILFGILGIIFSCVQAKDSEGKKPTQATVGLVLSIIGVVIAVVSMIFGAALGSSSMYQEILNQANSSVN